ncbi:MAG TPA: hypothetical protein VN752_10545 [Solirubrobacterales bacterium]|nr:hypothetical protein [Solirubrobacterales bacterium]
MRTYENPTIVTLGTVVELTEHKCNGSGDSVFPQLNPSPTEPVCLPENS